MIPGPTPPTTAKTSRKSALTWMARLLLSPPLYTSRQNEYLSGGDVLRPPSGPRGCAWPGGRGSERGLVGDTARGAVGAFGKDEGRRLKDESRPLWFILPPSAFRREERGYAHEELVADRAADGGDDRDDGSVPRPGSAARRPGLPAPDLPRPPRSGRLLPHQFVRLLPPDEPPGAPANRLP